MLTPKSILLTLGAAVSLSPSLFAATPPTASTGATTPSTCIQSSLQRVYPRSAPATQTSFSLTAVRNHNVSVQLVAHNSTSAVLPAQAAIADDADLNVRVRRVGNVPMDHLTPGTRKEELEGFDHLPGLVPDPLLPETAASIAPFENAAFWVSVNIPAHASPGPRNLTFTVKTGADTVTTLTAAIDIRDVLLAKRKNFPVTHWWRPDCIFLHHKHAPLSDEFFATTEKYMRNLVEHGNNMLFVPTLENRREDFKQPMQLLLITRNGDKWNFDFQHVRRLVNMGKKLGFEYYEFPHIWLYWGVKFATPVYLTDNGTYTRVWSGEADGYSPDFLNFLKQYLDALHQFLQEEDILDVSYYHLSDEPNSGGPDAIERYEKARKILHDYAPWMDGKVMDALSDINYAKKGITDIPIPLVDTAKPYLDAGIPHWVYYCCGPTGDHLNRFMDTPLAKIRMSGWLFYRMKANGFLHWAYNYWFRLETDQMMDVYRHGDSGLYPGIPYGDPFVVYPGADGPVDSIRWEIFAESLQDYALLQQSGISPDDPLLAPINNYDDFPKTEEWIRDNLIMVIESAQRKTNDNSTTQTINQ